MLRNSVDASPFVDAHAGPLAQATRRLFGAYGRETARIGENRSEPGATKRVVRQGLTTRCGNSQEPPTGNPLVTGPRIRPLVHRRNGLNPRIMLWASVIARALVSRLASRLRRR